MAGNSNLGKAKTGKNDEFYTQLADIEAELKHYRKHFKGKIVFCNCDDPYESNFFKYFAMNFNYLGLKKLIATCYKGSPITYTQLNMFGDEERISVVKKEKTPYKIEITEIVDANGDGAVDLTDIEYLLQNRNNTLSLLEGDGDFRSGECIDLLKEADIVVTNPPFSLFREYVAQLFEYGKNFLILGNMNAITYKEFFPLLKNNMVWTGYKSFGGGMNMIMPKEIFDANKVSKYIINDKGDIIVNIMGVIWYTNLDIPKRHEILDLYKKYNPEEYPHYDNYNAINVDKTADIPEDYFGYMGVPITFFDKYNPEQFDILGLLQSSTDEQAGIPNLRYYNEFKEMRQDMTYTGSSGGKANGNPVLKGKSKKGNFLYNPITDEYVHSAYARILIKRKDT